MIIGKMKGAIFQISDNEKYTISIHKHNHKSRYLECVGTYRTTKPNPQRSHRVWKEDEGHVGKTFVSNSTNPVIYADASIPEVEKLIKPLKRNLRAQDSEQYVSFAGIKIPDVSSDVSEKGSSKELNELPVGVLSLSSNEPMRFAHPDDSVPVESHNGEQNDNRDLAMDALEYFASQIGWLVYILEFNNSIT